MSDLLDTKLEIHDSRQFELKLNYQPSGTDPESKYDVEAWLFIPRSLNIDPHTWPRESFYADIHNYVRLKTPVLSFDELLTGQHSPLLQLEERLQLGLLGPETEIVYDAKMLSCVFRGVMRRFLRGMRQECSTLTRGHEASEHAPATSDQIVNLARTSIEATRQVLQRFRRAVEQLSSKYTLSEKTRASLRLVDEYLSLTVEQYFRRIVVQMDATPKSGVYVELRRELMNVVVTDENYRRINHLRSVIEPGTDNEEYTHRVSFLKKFCMNILFLKVARSAQRQAWEEVLFAIAAGGAMSFALAVGLFAQSRYPQASFNFFVIAVMGYMVKDRVKEGLRRLFAKFAGRYLYERKTLIIDPVTQDDVGVCREKVDFAGDSMVPADVSSVRARDDLVTVAQGELAETVIRYRKQISLNSEMLPRLGDGIVTGVTDIIRFNIERLLHDMDDPEYAIEYVDLEDFSVEKLRAAKSYHLDIAFRFSIDDGKHKSCSVRMIRLVLDKNGIKRMTEIDPAVPTAQISPVPASAA